MVSFLRRLTINVENLSQDHRCAFVFSGENFESGGWKEQRTQRITDFAALEFESQSLFSGLSGYVVFSNTDHSQLLTMAFTVPITTAPCFSATGQQVGHDEISMFFFDSLTNNFQQVGRDAFGT